MAFCEFGKTVKKKLVDIDKPQEWLIGEIKTRTGLFIDNGYLYKILTGQRKAPKIVDAICEVLDIEKTTVDALLANNQQAPVQN